MKYVKNMFVCTQKGNRTLTPFGTWPSTMPVYQIPASGFVFIKLSCLCRSRTYIKRTKISCITVILKGIVRRVGFPPTRYLVLVTIPPLPLICLMLAQLTLRCDPSGTRTLDLLIKSQQLYQLS